MSKKKLSNPAEEAANIADAAVNDAECGLNSTWPNIPERVALEAFIDAFDTLVAAWRSRLEEVVEEGTDG